MGTLVVFVGALCFAGAVFTGVANFGNFDDFEARGRRMGMLAFGGMMLIVVGYTLRAIGAQGAAGAGLVLDPERARRELEPHSRQVGGMIGDALDEAGIAIGEREPQPVERVVMIRCTSCATLNEDGSKFCQECGAAL